jgi:hypothetical protein
MRLSNSKIKQGILHAEQSVRDAAVSHFAMEHSDDRTVMPLASEAIDTHGSQEAFSEIDALQSLAQSDQTISWLTSEVSQIGDPTDDQQWEYVSDLSWILAEADVHLLKRRRKDILALRFLNADARESIQQRTRLLSVAPESCWREFEECGQQLGGGQPNSTNVLRRAYQLLEVISHHPQKFSERLLSLLAEDADQRDIARAWMQACAIRGAGQMRLADAIPHLVTLVQANHEEWVREDCVIALARIGGDPVVKAVWNACAIAPPEFHEYAAWVLESVHCDLTVEAAQHLLQESSDLSTKIAYGYALLSNFAIDGIAPVRHLIVNHADSEGMDDLRQALIAVCTLMEAEFSELENWRAQFREEESFRQQWQSPAFPVVDTWSAPLGEASKRKQTNVPSQPPPLRFPKNPQFQGIRRNDACPCNSGKKFKNCCMRRQ